MLSVIWLGIIIISLVYGTLTNVIEVNNVILNTSYESLDVFFRIASALVLWGGILEVAKNTGFLNFCTKKINFITKLIFKTKNQNTLSLISANLVCNFLGLSNLATPFSLEAISELKKEEKNMDIQSLLVLNYVGLSALPMQMLALRTSYDATYVLQLIPSIVAIGLFNSIVGLVLVRVIKWST